MDKETRQLYLKTVGERLKKSRVSKGLSLRRLSIICKIDYSDISKIERGEINMRFGTFLALAIGLEMHPKTILDFDITTQS